MKQQKRAQREDTSTYYVWIGGSCDYGHKERAGGAAVVIEHNGSIISRDVISDHNSVGVKIVQYHKSPLLIETHDRATEAMAKTRKEFHQKNKWMFRGVFRSLRSLRISGYSRSTSTWEIRLNGHRLNQKKDVADARFLVFCADGVFTHESITK